MSPGNATSREPVNSLAPAISPYRSNQHMQEEGIYFVIPTCRLRDVGETVERYDEHFRRNARTRRRPRPRPGTLRATGLVRGLRLPALPGLPRSGDQRCRPAHLLHPAAVARVAWRIAHPQFGASWRYHRFVAGLAGTRRRRQRDSPRRGCPSTGCKVMPSPPPDKFRRLLVHQDWDQLVGVLPRLDPSVAADLFQEIPVDQRGALFRRLPIAFASRVTELLPYHDTF